MDMRRPLRLLTIATLYPAPVRPGFGRFVQNQTRALAARGDWDVTVMNPISLPPWPLGRGAPLHGTPTSEQDGQITVHHPRYPQLGGLFANLNPSLIARAVLPLARRLHAQTPFDLVDAQFFYPDGPAAAAIAQELGVPLAIKARGSDIHYWGSRSGPLRKMRAAADQASALLSVSAALGRDMVALGMPEDRIAVHYTGLDRSRFYPQPRAIARMKAAELGVPADGRLVISVGALIPIKGQALAIAALANLPGDVRLALVGAGADDAELRNLADRSALADRVLFLGNQGHDAVPTLLSAADAMVLASEREGLANAWIEALACGAPIVIPDIGGAREIVSSPAAGRIVERTPRGIAAGLAEVLAAAIPQHEVAACAARFSWDANAEAMATIYRAIVTGNRAF
ncbi:glycosyltransferase [Novosphingobium sp.]|uniref:glycosyltransferase n=1 Tax=Novosphingobium sp. TaxID=1874826 RepID=UPI0038B7D9E0